MHKNYILGLTEVMHILLMEVQPIALLHLLVVQEEIAEAVVAVAVAVAVVAAADVVVEGISVSVWFRLAERNCSFYSSELRPVSNPRSDH
jgi:hypothetical protein